MENALIRVVSLNVLLIDGFQTTSDNVHGCLISLIQAAGFIFVAKIHDAMTPFGILLSPERSGQQKDERKCEIKRNEQNQPGSPVDQAKIGLASGGVRVITGTSLIATIVVATTVVGALIGSIPIGATLMLFFVYSTKLIVETLILSPGTRLLMKCLMLRIKPRVEPFMRSTSTQSDNERSSQWNREKGVL